MPARALLEQLIALVKQGKYLEAIAPEATHGDIPGGV